MQENTIEFPQVVKRGCGIDVHKDLIVATISGEGLEEQTKEFGAFSSSIEALRDWLKEHGVTHIAMESTSVYWKPVFNILEEHVEILLVNAQHIKNVPGRKTDKKDSAWIAQLLLSGLLKGSFIPPRPIREMRDLFRYKKKLTGQTVGEKNRVQKILEDANIKIGSVVSDLFGVSGMRILQSIIDGETDAEKLADLAHGTLQKKRHQLIESLRGKITAHHRFMLKTILQSLQQVENTISEIEAEADRRLQEYQVEMELLQTIPGVGKHTAGVIMAEIGNDMSKFPSQHHLASWAGISPGNNESAGKKKVLA